MRGLSFIAVIGVLALAGCNTMYEGTYQKITVHTPGVKNVNCVLENDHVRYDVIAPGSAIVDRAKGSLTVTCEKAGYITKVDTIKSKLYLNPTAMNAYNGFLGVFYDFASKSVYDYPENIVMKMEPDPNRLVLQPLETRVLQKKPEEPKTKALTDEDKAATEKMFSKSAKK